MKLAGLPSNHRVGLCAALSLAAGLILIEPACSPSDDAPERTAPAAAQPVSHGSFSLLSAKFEQRFGVKLVAAPPPADSRVATRLASEADEMARLRDASGMALGFRLLGARRVAATGTDQYRWFPAAGPFGADVVQLSGADGIEDFVLFEARPAREQIRYQVDLEQVAGLRLVENSLELLDQDGSPRLRVAPPYLISAGRQGQPKRVHPAEMTLIGCDHDRSPQPPWGRQLVAAGADHCVLQLSWQHQDVHYPALLDPKWVATTNSMFAPRTRHTMNELAPGSSGSLVLIAGGFDSGGNALNSAELYNPLTRTFAVTSAMNTARGAHTATSLTAIPPDGSLIPIVLVGGSDTKNGTPLASIEVYNPSTGLFATDVNNLPLARFDHSAAQYKQNEMLIVGGLAPALNQPTATGYVYSFTAFDGLGQPDSTLTATADMGSARSSLAVVRLSTNDVLVTGGFVLSGTALNSAEVFKPLSKSFVPTTATGNAVVKMAALRAKHTATRLDSGQVLIAGGTNQTSGGLFHATIDLYHDGTQNPAIEGFEIQPSPITMTNARGYHSASLLPTGAVVLAGGTDANGALSSVELFDPASKQLSLLSPAPPLDARANHAAITVSAGESLTAGAGVLVSGGEGAAGNVLASAQVLINENGDPCTLAVECLSGFCAQGVCCDEACDELCYTCTAAAKGAGSDGTCGFAKADTELPTQCENEAEVHAACDGAGAVKVTSVTDCKPRTCNAAKTLCSQYCNKDNPCSDSGWCNFDSGQGGGGAAAGAGGAGGSGGGIPEGAGQCEAKRPISTACDEGRQCTTGHCVDGVCCNLACDQQCEACDVANKLGFCTNVGSAESPEPPHPNSAGENPRQDCAGTGTGCSGFCTGVSASVCTYPGAEKEHGASVCSCPNDDCETGPATEAHQRCNGMGSFAEELISCEGFRCADAEVCATSCQVDADCIVDHICVDSACEKLTGPNCDGDHTVRIPAADDEDCSPYTCDASSCRQKCTSVSECVSPAVCNAEGKCVSQLTAPEVASCNCRTAGARNQPAPWCWLLALMLTAHLRRRHGAS